MEISAQFKQFVDFARTANAAGSAPKSMPYRFPLPRYTPGER